MDLGLDGRVCVVTGASRGIGLAVSSRLVAEGARVLMVARDAERLARAAEDVGAEWLAADVTDPDCDERIVATARRAARRHRRAGQQRGDLVARAAGRADRRRLARQHELQRDGADAADARSPRRGWRSAAGGGSSTSRRRRASGRGSPTSPTRWPRPGSCRVSRAFADAYAAKGVLVNAVTPGPTATELWVGEGGLADQAAAASGTTREEALAAAAKKVPAGALRDAAEEIADVVVFLCCERAGNVAGRRVVGRRRRRQRHHLAPTPRAARAARPARPRRRRSPSATGVLRRGAPARRS